MPLHLIVQLSSIVEYIPINNTIALALITAPLFDIMIMYRVVLKSEGRVGGVGRVGRP
jgi:hypothetical protein